MKLLAALLAGFLLGRGTTGRGACKPSTETTRSLHELSTRLEGLSRQVSRSLVQVFSTGYVVGGEGETGTNAAVVTRQRATGSGVLLSADGYIVTNNHVVANAHRVRVRLAVESPATPPCSRPGKCWTRGS